MSYLEEHAFLCKPFNRGAAHIAQAEGLTVSAMQLISRPLGHNLSQIPERLTAPSVCDWLGPQTAQLKVHFCSKHQGSHSNEGTVTIEGHSQSRRALGNQGEPGR